MARRNSYITADIILNHPGSGAGGAVGSLKLIKLVYIAHGYHLALIGEPLLAEPVEAWKYGPVVAGIYDAVRHFRANPIAPDLFKLYRQDRELLSDKSRRVIDEVAGAYGAHDGLALSAMTHLDGTPWDITYKKRGEYAVIPNKLIRDYYRERIQPVG